MTAKTAIIIGAGPAGLTAAYEFLDKTLVKPVVLEASGELGGIAKTVNYKGNRIDIGGHRFFSKSARVMQWWLNILPLQGYPSKDDLILGRDVPLSPMVTQRSLGSKEARVGPAPDPERTDIVMLVRRRLSRIFFLRKFFDYPVSFNANTFISLGVIRILRILWSYSCIHLFPIKQEKNLEDFFINRFGKELYATFFEDYTQKVWGVPCRMIKSEWGAQRIKSLSIPRAILHAIKRIFLKNSSLEQTKTETSLIEQFMYPKFGPGQMWEEVCRIIQNKGAEIHLHHEVIRLSLKEGQINEVQARNTTTGQITTFKGDYIFSTMAIKDLIQSIEGDIPENIRDLAAGLQYRDFITVGLLLKKLKVKNQTNIKTINNIVPDNWIYIQEPDVKLCRLQIFNNWSPYLVKDPNTVWVGLEYMLNVGDELWAKSDVEFAKFAIKELVSIGMIDESDVLDRVVIRVLKAYPAYFGTYERFDQIRAFTDKIENLFLIGRNGMHRYNNQDHSMLTAITAVENIIQGRKAKDNIWSVNVEQDYHEEKNLGENQAEEKVLSVSPVY